MTISQPQATTARGTASRFYNPTDDANALPLVNGEVIWDLSSSKPATITLSSDVKFTNPENMVAHRKYNLFIQQDSVGGRKVNWGAAFNNWDGEAEPVLPLNPGTIAIIEFYCDGSQMYGKLFYKSPEGLDS